jgi:hypothetical protein
MNARIESPYFQGAGAIWLRGNLHTHTQRSDGAASPQDTILHYARLGYDFLMLSDHDVLADYRGLDAHGMTLLRGVEVCGGGPHLLDVGARRLVNAQSDLQRQIDQINRQSGFVVLCHPNWEDDYDHYPFSQLTALKDYRGIEIFNGTVIHMTGNHLATDKWDRLLAAGRRVWGYANDDAHGLSDRGLGWNVVRVKARTPGAILAALKNGSFYASSGAEISEIRVHGSHIHLEAPNADRIAVVAPGSCRVAVVDGSVLDYDVSNLAAPYFRVECYGRGGMMAWTQAMAIHNGTYAQRQRQLAKAVAGARSTLHAYRSTRAPAMTGLIDDPLWAKALPFNRFINNEDAAPAPLTSELRCVLAGKTLFLAVKCEEPQLEKMKLTIDRDGQGSLWTNDGIEFFLDVQGLGRNCYHMMVNANGFSHATVRGQGEVQNPKVAAKAGRWQEAPRHGWSVEFAVDLEQLGAKTSKGRRLGLHVCRGRPGSGGCYVWSWTGGSNHNVSQYGSLML